MGKKSGVGEMITGHNVRVVVDPQLTARQECNRSRPSTKVFTVFRNQQIVTVKNKILDIINNS